MRLGALVQLSGLHPDLHLTVVTLTASPPTHMQVSMLLGVVVSVVSPTPVAVTLLAAELSHLAAQTLHYRRLNAKRLVTKKGCRRAGLSLLHRSLDPKEGLLPLLQVGGSSC